MCFTGPWVLQMVVWAIIIGAIIAIVKVVLPIVLRQFGPLGELASAVVAIIKIVLWAFALILLAYFAYDMIMCLAQHLPPLPSARRG